MDEGNGSLVRKNSISLSYRLDKTLYDLVKKDAEAKGVSVNSLINSIIKSYMSWERYAHEIGFIPLAKDTVRLLFNELDQKSIQKIAERLGASVPKELILLMFNKLDFDSIVSFMDITLSRYGTVQHTVNGDAHEFVLRHNVSKKFSHFLGEGGKAMAESLSFRFKVLHEDSRILSIRIQEFSSE
jgi:hypothetical protein